MTKRTLFVSVLTIFGLGILPSLASAQLSGQKFDCKTFQIYFNTDSSWGENSGVEANGQQSPAVFTSVSSFPIYQTYLAETLSSGSGFYFIAKSDVAKPRKDKKYLIMLFSKPLVSLSSDHQSFECDYVGKS